MKTKKELEKENSILKSIVEDSLWMARRYADQRMTYAVSDYNRAVAQALDLNMKIVPDEPNQKVGKYEFVKKTIWAKDGHTKWPRDLIAKHGHHESIPFDTQGDRYWDKKNKTEYFVSYDDELLHSFIPQLRFVIKRYLRKYETIDKMYWECKGDGSNFEIIQQGLDNIAKSYSYEKIGTGIPEVKIIGMCPNCASENIKYDNINITPLCLDCQYKIDKEKWIKDNLLFAANKRPTKQDIILEWNKLNADSLKKIYDSRETI